MSSQEKKQQKKQKFKTAFSESYKKEFNFIDCCSDDQYSAFCKVCRCSINIAYEGRLAIVNHGKTEKHKKNQRLTNAAVTNPKITLVFKKSNDNSVINAEVRFMFIKKKINK